MQRKFRAIIAFTVIFILTIFSLNTYAESLKYKNVDMCVNDITSMNGIYTLQSYNFDGYNYFKLRDLAYLLKSTTSQFDVSWNKNLNMIEIEIGLPYDGEYELNYFSARKAVSTVVDISVDGSVHRVNAYNIDGNSYFKLRDLGDLLNFRIELLEDDNTVYIYTNMNENTIISNSEYTLTYNKMEKGVKNPSSGSKNTTFVYCDSYINVVDANNENKSIYIEKYSKKSYELIESHTINFTFDKFGGFYSGKDYNYIVFGNNNIEENDNKEVIRIIKYDKDFNEISHATITGGMCFTTKPFDAGSVSLAENDHELVVHTSRERYTSEDGLNHQSSLTILLDTETMKVKNSLDLFQVNHVRHSFSQFVKFDGKEFVLSDLGDGYPRGVVLNKLVANEDKIDNENEIENLIYKIPGDIGVNYTCTRVGGLEVSDTSYLVAITSADQSKLNYVASKFMSGYIEEYEPGASNKYDVILLVADKSDFSDENVKQIKLSNCISKNMQASVPYIVKLSDNRFVVLWQEFKSNGWSWGIDYGVKYAEVDGNGNMLSEIKSIKHSALSEDCQPIYTDGKIVWFVNTAVGRAFYSIDL